MNRTTFLQRVRQAAYQGRAYRVATREIPLGTGYVGATGDLCDHFASEVNLVGGHAVVVRGDDAAREELAKLLQHYAVQRCVRWQHPLLEQLAVDTLLAERHIAIDEHGTLSILEHDEQRQHFLCAEVGITSCAWAIAETGTLVMCHRPGRERSTSLVPPVHIAIVETAQILPDLLDVFARLPAAAEKGLTALPSNVTLITGPSKTGDIELQLTTGVHGPKHWHVIVVRR